MMESVCGEGEGVVVEVSPVGWNEEGWPRIAAVALKLRARCANYCQYI